MCVAFSLVVLITNVQIPICSFGWSEAVAEVSYQRMQPNNPYLTHYSILQLNPYHKSPEHMYKTDTEIIDSNSGLARLHVHVLVPFKIKLWVQ